MTDLAQASHVRARTVTRRRLGARGVVRTARALVLTAVLLLAAVLLPAAAHADFVLSGTATADEAFTEPWGGCNGTTANVTLSFNGGAAQSVACNKTTGAFSFNVTTALSNRVIAVFLDDAAIQPGGGAVTYTRNLNSTAALANVRLVRGRVTLETRSGTNASTADIIRYDKTNNARIPVDASNSGNDVVVDADTEVHVPAGQTVVQTLNLTTPKLHVGAGGIYTGAPNGSLQLTSGGELGCSAGPPLMRPLCIEGTFAAPEWVGYFVDSDVVVDTAPTYEDVELGYEDALGTLSGKTPVFTIGTGTGQTMRATGGFWSGRLYPQGKAIIDGTKWAPNWQVGELLIGMHSILRQYSAGTMLVTRSAYGSGTIDMPSVDVTLNSVLDRSIFGPGHYMEGGDMGDGTSWEFGSVTFTSQESRTAVPGHGSGRRVVDNGGNDDSFTAKLKSSEWWHTEWAGTTSANGGDWLMEPYDGSARRTWNSGGAVADTLVSARSLSWGGNRYSVYVGRTDRNGGDWAIGIFNQDGTTYAPWGTATNVGETMFNGVRTFNSGGTNADDAVDAYVGSIGGNERLFVFGNIGTNGGDWAVRAYDPTTGALDTAWSFNSGGVQADRLNTVVRRWGVMDLGGSIGTNGGDAAIRQFLPEDYGSLGFQDERSSGGGGCSDVTGPCVTSASCTRFGCRFYWNSGGVQPDAITAMWEFDTHMNDTGSPYSRHPTEEPFADCGIAAGTTDVGGNVNGAIMRACGGSGLDPSYGTSGVTTWDSGGDDVPKGIDAKLNATTVAGTSSTGGGDWVLRRYDMDGDLDQTFGTNGVVTVNDGVGDSANAIWFADRYASIFDVPQNDAVFTVGGRTPASGGGDAIVRVYDYDGALADGTANGATTYVTRPGRRNSYPQVRVNGNLTVGAAAGAKTFLDVDHGEQLFDVRGNVTVASQGMLRGARLAGMRVGGDFAVQAGGTYLPQGGTVTWTNADRVSTLSALGGPSFGSWRITEPGKRVVLPAGATTSLSGTLTVNGAACGTRADLRSSVASTPATLAVAGATSVTYATLTDLTATPGITATNSVNGGGNTGWTITGACGADPPRRPSDLFAADANAQPGVAHNANITSATPHFAWINRASATIDRQGVEVWNTVNDSSVVALWHHNATGSGTDADVGTGSIGCGAMTKSATATWVSGGRFSNALQTNGATTQYAQSAATCTLPTSYTVEAWAKLDASVACTSAGADRNHEFVRDGGTNKNFSLSVDCGTNEYGNVVAAVRTTGPAETAWARTSINRPALDRQWHHYALVVDGDNHLVKLYVDGVAEADASSYGAFSGTPRTTVTKPEISNDGDCANSQTNCNAFNGVVDEVRISGRALTGPEVLGYYRTGAAHATRLWQSDPGGTGTVFTPATTCAAGARCADIVYGGAAGTLLLDGARYYARARFMTQGSSIWSDWSAPDWFETDTGMTVTVPSGSTVSLGGGPILPGTDAAATTTLNVTTNAGHGYTVYATDTMDAGGTGSGLASIPDWTGTPATPTNWPAGTSGGFGLTLLGLNGSKDAAAQARWGTGTNNVAYATLNYVGLSRTVPTTIVSRAGYSAATDVIDVGLRANVPATQRTGKYSNTVVFTVVPDV